MPSAVIGQIVFAVFIMMAVRRSWDGMSDAEIVELVRGGTTNAFEVLVNRYDRRLHGVVQKMLHDREETADVVQDAFIRAYGALETFDTSRAFYTWICRIAMNLALNVIEKQKRRATDSLDEKAEDTGFEPISDADTTAMTHEAELTRAVTAALDDLPDGMREVFVLRVYDELSYDEIAETLEIPRGTVMSRLSRARTKLQADLGAFIDQED
jgi:RNA polymerase sigma-70 factor, ECF subfamily